MALKLVGAEVDRRPREFAKRLYLKARSTPATPGAEQDSTSPHAALTLVCVWLQARADLPDHAPPAAYDLLAAWCSEEGWEATFRRDLVKNLLDEEDPLKEVRYLRILQDDARRVLDLTMDALERPFSDNISTGSPLDADLWADSSPLVGVAAPIAEFHKYQIALKTFGDISEQLLDAEQRLRQRHLEQARDDIYKARVDEVHASLWEQYQGLGPQYELLCRDVAEAWVAYEYARKSGRTIAQEEINQLQTAYRTGIAALQKYTETSKSESINQETQKVVVAALSLIEEMVAPTQPQLWEAIVRRMQTRLPASVQAQRHSSDQRPRLIRALSIEETQPLSTPPGEDS